MEAMLRVFVCTTFTKACRINDSGEKGGKKIIKEHLSILMQFNAMKCKHFKFGSK